MEYLKTFESFTGGRILSLSEVKDISEPNDVYDVSEWLSKPLEGIEFKLVYEPISKFLDVAKDLEGTYINFPSEKRRTKNIYNLIKSGADVKAIFVDINDGFILEGRHRIVAFMWMNLQTIPVVYVS
jgi:hypothetical protein